MTPAQFRKISILAAECADQKKAEEILLLDLRSAEGSISDFLLILTANSTVHMEALDEFILDTLDEIGIHPVHRDGARSEHWKVLDYGGFIVHVFHQDYRSFYSLERLWEEAKEIKWKKGKRI